MNEDKIKIDRRYLAVHQAHENWENLYLFIYYSAAKNRWLCKECSEYCKGDDH